MRKQAIAGLAFVLALVSHASAHAILVEVTPAPNASVAGPDVVFQLRFNTRIDVARSRLSVVLADRSVRSLPLEPPSSPTTLNARVTGLRSGTYKLRWQVLATDGHITRGEVPFEVTQ